MRNFVGSFLADALNSISGIRSSETFPARVVDNTLKSIGSLTGIIVSGPGRGLRLNPGGFPGYWTGMHEPHLQKEIQKLIRPGDSVYDVGAFVGIVALLASRAVGSSGYVAAFEPDLGASSAIEASAKANSFVHLEVINAAVSDVDGELTISKFEGAHFSINSVPSGHLTETRTVAAITLDRFVSDGHRPPQLVKIDVEGAEIAVLSGMKNLLEQYFPIIICETHGTLDEVRDYLLKFGYTTDVLTDGYHIIARKKS